MRYFLIYITLFFSLMGFSQNVKNIDSLTMVGAMNAVKKAHQMTDLPIIPAVTFTSNPTAKESYVAGKKYKGVIYSSVKEINTYVGQDVSFHTFMTALHNPRSVLYTKRIDKKPYHGRNCRAYYGTVCSGLISYALGFKITQRSSDILVEDYFELISDQSAKSIRLADLICKNGHPRLVTGIKKDTNGNIISIEISVAANSGCKRYEVKGEEAFNQMLKKNKYKIYRYKELYKNTFYTPANEFVAVENEKLKHFTYNDDICANKGDKSCYITGENVILNVLGGGDKVEIYKDSILFKEIAIQKKDTNIVIKNYPYGDYQARVLNGRKKSDYTRWKIIDVKVNIDKEQNRICFSSANATPVYYEFCTVSGSRPDNGKRIYAAEFTEEQIKNGYVIVKAPTAPTKGKLGCSFVKVHFECDYGMVINKPVNWFK
jgi:hypothetical protein